MTANSFTSVSLDPMLVSFCVELDTRFEEAVRESGVWGVSVLRADARRRAGWFATGGRPLDGEFSGVPFRRGELTGTVLLDEAIAWLECRTEAIHPGGDHAIVVGEVLAMGAPALAEPLVFWAGEYRTIGDSQRDARDHSRDHSRDDA